MALLRVACSCRLIPLPQNLSAAPEQAPDVDERCDQAGEAQEAMAEDGTAEVHPEVDNPAGEDGEVLGEGPSQLAENPEAEDGEVLGDGLLQQVENPETQANRGQSEDPRVEKAAAATAKSKAAPQSCELAHWRFAPSRSSSLVQNNPSQSLPTPLSRTSHPSRYPFPSRPPCHCHPF